MNGAPGNLPDRDLRGLVCRSLRTSGFKLALVVGHSQLYKDRIRVSVWRAASKCWTQPTLVDVRTLTMLVEDDHTKRRALIKKASQAAFDLKLVGRVWS